MEAKGFRLEASYGPCLQTGPDTWEKAVYEDVFIFWIRIQHEPTGAWVDC